MVSIFENSRVPLDKSHQTNGTCFSNKQKTQAFGLCLKTALIWHFNVLLRRHANALTCVDAKKKKKKTSALASFGLREVFENLRTN